ncbi:hypothetical protein [Amycolatopsis alba]|uniref:HAF repeat-containing protein n=1 Tax=Amycolatopsis alba DSM 44262 TaxID=1125972 RepID=A0A229RFN8_AMYAL|nr:hypothetical protein [Amycolatopsis alba]OXM45395.1 hypothetical protein CFP75_31090 [Amycolatopsis alba DSM 44262]
MFGLTGPRLWRVTAAALLLSGLAAGPAEAHDPGNTRAPAVVDLGALPGGRSAATALNDNGVVVGDSTTAGSTTSHAVRWNRARRITDLGSVDGHDTFALGVNQRGTVFGFAENCSTDPLFDCALRWSAAGTLTRLAPLAAGKGARPVAMNDFDTVVGHADSASGGHRHPVRWTSGGQVVDLGLPSGAIDAVATGINNQGLIAGLAEYPSGPRALLWDRDDAVVELPSAPHQATSWTTGVTDDGLVIGEIARLDGFHMARWRYRREGTRPPEVIEAISYTFGMSRSGISFGAEFRWDRSGRVTVLAPPRVDGVGQPAAVNDAGVVIGSVVAPDGTGAAPVWWDRSGIAHEYPKPTPNAEARAHAINNAGITVGRADFSAGQHAALWH